MLRSQDFAAHLRRPFSKDPSRLTASTAFRGHPALCKTRQDVLHFNCLIESIRAVQEVLVGVLIARQPTCIGRSLNRARKTTKIRSRMTRGVRPKAGYFDEPKERGWCRTGSSAMAAPSVAAMAGISRWVSPYKRRAEARSARKALRLQPQSCSRTCGKRERELLGILLL